MLTQEEVIVLICISGHLELFLTLPGWCFVSYLVLGVCFSGCFVGIFGGSGLIFLRLQYLIVIVLLLPHFRFVRLLVLPFEQSLF